MNLLTLLITVLPLVGVIVWQQYLLMKTNEKWTRAFSAHVGLPPLIMESKPVLDEKVEMKKADTRRRITVPIPGASLWRKDKLNVSAS